MTFKTFSKSFLFVSFFFISSFAFFNYFINPYHIFNHNYFSKSLPLKKHTISSRMTIFYRAINSNPQNIIMGTSRAGVFPSTQITKYIQPSIQHLTIPGANIEEQSQYLKYVIKKYPLKEIIWSLDFFSFNPDLKNDSSFSYNRVDTSALFKDDYKTALFSLQTVKNSILTLSDNIKNKKLPKKKTTIEVLNSVSKEEIDIRTTGQLTYYSQKFLAHTSFNQPNSIQGNIDKIKEIINLCKEKNIKLHVYTSPVHVSFLQLYKTLGLQNTFTAWKKELAKITPYTDFCTNNTIAKNPYNFIDGTHLKPRLGKLIFAKIFQDTTVNVPNDFGTYINRDKD